LLKRLPAFLDSPPKLRRQPKAGNGKTAFLSKLKGMSALVALPVQGTLCFDTLALAVKWPG
jgi:hypothetical protein